MWNEPNLGEFFQDRVNADYYADAVLDPASYEIKRANSRARVVLGGLAEPNQGDAATYLYNMLYANGNNYIFDIVSIHPYWENTSKLSDTITGLRTIMGPSGYNLPTKKQIWVTEFGWSDRIRSPFHDQDDPNSATDSHTEYKERFRAASEEEQAAKVTAYLDWLQQSGQRDRSSYKTGPQFLYPEQGNEGTTVCGDDGLSWYCYSGLWKADGTARKMLTTGTGGGFSWVGFSNRASSYRLNYELPDSFGGNGWGQ